MMHKMKEIFRELMEEDESEIMNLEIEQKRRYMEYLEKINLIYDKKINMMKKDVEVHNTLIIELEELLKDDNNKEKTIYEEHLRKAKEDVDELEVIINDTKMEISKNQESIARYEEVIEETKNMFSEI